MYVRRHCSRLETLNHNSFLHIVWTFMGHNYGEWSYGAGYPEYLYVVWKVTRLIWKLPLQNIVIYCKQLIILWLVWHPLHLFSHPSDNAGDQYYFNNYFLNCDLFIY